MNPVWVFGVALVAVFGGLALRRYSPEMAPLLPLMGMVLLFSAVLPLVGSVLSAVTDLGQRSGLDSDSIGLILRGVGIVLVTRLAAGVCNDNGQRALGETVEYCGQIAIVSLAVPLIVDLAQKMMEVKF